MSETQGYQKADAPDANCITTLDGGCESTVPCMHWLPEDVARYAEIEAITHAAYAGDRTRSPERDVRFLLAELDRLQGVIRTLSRARCHVCDSGPLDVNTATHDCPDKPRRSDDA